MLYYYHSYNSLPKTGESQFNSSDPLEFHWSYTSLKLSSLNDNKARVSEDEGKLGVVTQGQLPTRGKTLTPHNTAVPSDDHTSIQNLC